MCARPEASATFLSRSSSAGSGSVWPGVQSAVIASASNPARVASATRSSAAAGSGCLTTSSRAPTQMPREASSSDARRQSAQAPAASVAASAAASRIRVTVTTLDCVERQVSKLEDKLKKLPAKPGVYLFRDDRGQILYVGKAKSLRPRVRSYFQKGETRTTIAQLPDRVADLEVIVTGTEVEALHLE